MDVKILIKNELKALKIIIASLLFTHITGMPKSVDKPVLWFSKGCFEEGVHFDGFSFEGFSRIQESNIRLLTDPVTYASHPLRKENIK